MPDASKVHVYDDGSLKNSFNVDGSGNWSGQISGVTAGASDITAKAEDAAGNISSQTLKKVYTGSTTLPSCDLLDDSGESSTDNITNDNTPQVKVNLTLENENAAMGVNVAEASVAALRLQHSDDGGTTWNTIEENTNPSYAAPANFNFTHQITAGLADGDHKFRAAWQDAMGNWSAYGNELTVTIDTTAPSAPTVSEPVSGQVYVGTAIDVSGTAS